MNIGTIFLILFAGGTFLVSLLQYIRQLVKDMTDTSKKK